MTERHEELLNVYDSNGRVVGARPRREAKASGLAVGAINLLISDGQGRVLLQRRPPDQENGGRWDKSVGGHVGAGETFEATVVREAREELFDDHDAGRVRLYPSEESYRAAVAQGGASSSVALRWVATHLNVRDVRHAPGGGLRNVLYHVGVFRGQTGLGLKDFTPQAAEIAELAFFEPAQVDALLLRGDLAPNMALLWLTEAQALLAESRVASG